MTLQEKTFIALRNALVELAEANREREDFNTRVREMFGGKTIKKGKEITMKNMEFYREMEGFNYLDYARGNSSLLQHRDFAESGGTAAVMMQSIVRELCIAGSGSFVKALLKNDLMKAVAAGDSENVLLLDLYAKFIYNVIPDDILQEYRNTAV